MATKTKRKKKKVTSQDFLKLLEEQDAGGERTAFRPRRQNRSRIKPVPSKIAEFALIRAPVTFITAAATLVGRLRR